MPQARSDKPGKGILSSLRESRAASHVWGSTITTYQPRHYAKNCIYSNPEHPKQNSRAVPPDRPEMDIL